MLSSRLCWRGRLTCQQWTSREPLVPTQHHCAALQSEHAMSPLPLALHAASLAGHAACGQLLLQHGADVDAVDQNGHTPLFRACERGHTEAVVVLLNAGAAVDLLDSGGRSCLHWAASGGLSVICSSLLRQGLPVDGGDHSG